MNTLLDIALTSAAVATLLAAGVAFVTWRFRFRPAVRHALWLLVLIKLIAPPLVPVRVAWPARAEPSAGRERVAQEVVDLDAWTEMELAPSDVLVWSEPVGVAGPEATPVAPASERSDGVAGAPASFATREITWRMVVAAVWLAGSVIWLSIALARILRFQRVLRDAKPAGESVCEHVHDVASRIGLWRRPRVVMTSGTVSPLVWGFGIRPKLLIPNALWSRLAHEQRTTLLIHELAHLRRGDHLVRLLELVVTGAYWWHPVVWWARRAIRDAEEQCCDAWVVWAEPKSARSYATALLETVEFLSRSPGQPFAAPAAATGLGHVDHLKRRLTMILRGTTPRRLSPGGALAILGLAGVLLPLAPIAAQEEAKPADVVETHETITQSDVVPTVTGDVTIETATPVTIDGEPESNPDLIVVKKQDETKEENPDKTADEKKNKDDELTIARLRAELSALQARQAQVVKELQERLASAGGNVDVFRADRLRLQGQDGSVTILGSDGGKPGSKAVVRRLKVNPDGVTTVVTEDIVNLIDGKTIIVSAEEQALREAEAQAQEAYNLASRLVRKPSSDPALKHRKAKLEEIRAKLRDIQAAKSDLSKQMYEGAIKQAEEELANAQDRLEWSNKMNKIGYVSASQNGADKLAMERARTNLETLEQARRIDALEKKLDSVLDELKRLKGGEEGDKNKTAE